MTLVLLWLCAQYSYKHYLIYWIWCLHSRSTALCHFKIQGTQVLQYQAKHSTKVSKLSTEQTTVSCKMQGHAETSELVSQAEQNWIQLSHHRTPVLGSDMGTAILHLGCIQEMQSPMCTERCKLLCGHIALSSSFTRSFPRVQTCWDWLWGLF